MVYLAIFFSKNLKGRLAKFFTGCYAYHTAWVDLDNDKYYDMSLIRERRVWSTNKPDGKYALYEAPWMSKEYLEHQLETDTDMYGIVDYLLFTLRPFISLKNHHGKICSEMINIDCWSNLKITPWGPQSEPPSPCDLYNWAKHRLVSCPVKI